MKAVRANLEQKTTFDKSFSGLYAAKTFHLCQTRPVVESCLVDGFWLDGSLKLWRVETAGIRVVRRLDNSKIELLSQQSHLF